GGRAMVCLRSIVVAAFAVLLAAGPAAAHKERPISSPPRPGSVPDLARVNPKRLVVCKPSSNPTDEQLADIDARLATAVGDAHDRALRELAAWHRNTALFAECCFQHIPDAVEAPTTATAILS